jgi:hypothetical protein
MLSIVSGDVITERGTTGNPKRGVDERAKGVTEVNRAHRLYHGILSA